MGNDSQSVQEPTVHRSDRRWTGAPAVADDRVYLSLPDAAYDRLIKAFLQELGKTPFLPGEDWTLSQAAWCCFVFAAIALGGVASPDALSEILQMRFKHLVTAINGFILIPRAGGAVPVFVSDVVAACALSLCVHLMRGRGGGRNRLGPFPSEGYILPGRRDPCAPPTVEEMRQWRERFRVWLWELGKAARLHVTVGKLALLARGRLAQVYSPPVAGVMLGFHLPDSAPPEQRDVLDSYRRPFDWNRVMRSSVAPRASRRFKPCFQAAAPGSPSAESEGQEKKLPESLIQLRKIVIAYSRADKAAARIVRKCVLQALRSFQQEMEARLGKSEAESWGKLLLRLDKHTLAIEQIDAFNGAVLAAWLANMIRSKPPNTVEARLNDAIKLARSMPGRLVFQLEESALFGAIAAWPLSQSSRARLADSVQGLYHFVTSTLEMPVPVIAWWRLRKQRIICERRVFSQPDLEKLLVDLRGMGRAGSLAIIGVLLSYYFGLRASEICHVRLGDLWLEGTPTVFVWRSKGGHSRFVEGIEIPQAIIQVLRQFQQRRLQQVSGARSALLLQDAQGRPLTRQRLVRILAGAMERCNLSLDAGEKRSVVHVLRHACANRWWALAMPLIEITRRLGHRSVDTTMSVYLHVAHFLQAEQLAAHPARGELRWSPVAAAAMFGITPRRLRQLVRDLQMQGFARPNSEAGSYSMDWMMKQLIAAVARNLPE